MKKQVSIHKYLFIYIYTYHWLFTEQHMDTWWVLKQHVWLNKTKKSTSSAEFGFPQSASWFCREDKVTSQWSQCSTELTVFTPQSTLLSVFKGSNPDCSESKRVWRFPNMGVPPQIIYFKGIFHDFPLNYPAFLDVFGVPPWRWKAPHRHEKIPKHPRLDALLAGAASRNLRVVPSPKVKKSTGLVVVKSLWNPYEIPMKPYQSSIFSLFNQFNLMKSWVFFPS